MILDLLASSSDRTRQAQDGLEPLSDASNVSASWSSIASRLGVTQAEAQRMAYRLLIKVADLRDEVEQ